MEISEVRVKIVANQDDRLKAFCSMTLDNEFVIRDIKIIEGAGGPLVPLNEDQFVIDIAKKFNIPVILVVSNYLGCINHSLLCLNFLSQQQFNLAGIVLNGNFETEVERSIINFKPVKLLAKIPFDELPDKNFVKLQASLIDKNLFS